MSVVSGQISYAPVIADMHAVCFETPWTEAELQTLLALPTTVAWLTEQGFLLCSRVLDEMEILTVGVLPPYRRQGVAHALLQEMITYAKERGITRIFLEVSAENRAAQGLYRKVGFQQTGRRQGYYRTAKGPTDALCLTLSIT